MTPDQLRAEAADFTAASVEAGVACPAFGAIMPPRMFDRARVWQRCGTR